MDFLLHDPVISPMGTLMSTFFYGFTSILLLLWYSTRNFDYWKKRGIPFTKPYPFLGSMLEYLTKPLHDVELDRYRNYGRIYGHFEGNRPLLSIGDAEILRDILVKDFQVFSGTREAKTGHNITDGVLSILQGEDWKRVRSTVSPAFSTTKIKRVIGIFKECSKTLVENLKKSAEKEETINAKSIYSAFAMDIIASAAFSTKIDSHNDPNNEFVATARAVTKTFNWRFVLFLLCPAIVRIFRISLLSPKTMVFFTDVTTQIIEKRKKTGEKRNDFLQLLMDTEREVSEEGKFDLKEEENSITENYSMDESDAGFKNVVSKRFLSRDELISQCVVFFLGGYDTAASTLTFASYFLALNPDIQEKLIQEIDDVLRDNNGELTYEAIQAMKYLDNVISETLRFFPPGVRLERKAIEHYKLENRGIKIPKGMMISIPIIAMHRDPEYFPEPEKFNPDRFLPEERAKRNPYSYMPFGAGPRNCVGMRFALMEIKVCLAYVFSNFRLRKCQQTKDPLEFYKGQGLLQPKDVILQLEMRTDTVSTL